MKKSAVLELRRKLVELRKEIGQLAHTKLCAEILHCWLEANVMGLDNEQFASEMIERFENGKYPFNQ